ncbi:hypothetical protein G7046_g7143 [Stylonectria norvegica]|nr:hypothetical protein G7046_g7143 [Stylonectria norvegica]
MSLPLTGRIKCDPLVHRQPGEAFSRNLDAGQNPTEASSVSLTSIEHLSPRRRGDKASPVCEHRRGQDKSSRGAQPGSRSIEDGTSKFIILTERNLSVLDDDDTLRIQPPDNPRAVSPAYLP